MEMYDCCEKVVAYIAITGMVGVIFVWVFS